jgi:hypothetical protein
MPWRPDEHGREGQGEGLAGGRAIRQAEVDIGGQARRAIGGVGDGLTRRRHGVLAADAGEPWVVMAKPMTTSSNPARMAYHGRAAGGGE